MCKEDYSQGKGTCQMMHVPFGLLSLVSLLSLAGFAGWAALCAGFNVSTDTGSSARGFVNCEELVHGELLDAGRARYVDRVEKFAEVRLVHAERGGE